nr:MAG TPA: hypothetical protein [Caudoviricetes sp.]
MSTPILKLFYTEDKNLLDLPRHLCYDILVR